MVLLLKGNRSFAIVELTITFTPVGCISVIGGFNPFNHDVFIFGVARILYGNKLNGIETNSYHQANAYLLDEVCNNLCWHSL